MLCTENVVSGCVLVRCSGGTFLTNQTAGLSATSTASTRRVPDSGLDFTSYTVLHPHFLMDAYTT